MTTTTTSPEFIHALTLALNSAVSVAYATREVAAEKKDAATKEYSAACHLDTLQTQFDILCNDLYLVTPPGVLDDMLDELDNAITCGDVISVVRIRDRELSKHSHEVARVRDVDSKIKDIESKIAHLRSQLSELEEERAQNVSTAVESGCTVGQIAEATGRGVFEVDDWVRGV